MALLRKLGHPLPETATFLHLQPRSNPLGEAKAGEGGGGTPPDTFLHLKPRSNPLREAKASRVTPPDTFLAKAWHS